MVLSSNIATELSRYKGILVRKSGILAAKEGFFYLFENRLLPARCLYTSLQGEWLAWTSNKHSILKNSNDDKLDLKDFLCLLEVPYGVEEEEKIYAIFVACPSKPLSATLFTDSLLAEIIRYLGQSHSLKIADEPALRVFENQINKNLCDAIAHIKDLGDSI